MATARRARTAEEHFALNTDRAAEYTNRAMRANELLVDQKIITPERGTVLNDALLAVNAANKELIVAGRKFIVEEDGKRILRFTEEGRIELDRLAQALAGAATNVVNHPALLRIDPKARSQLIALIAPVQLAATTLVKLIKRAKSITVLNGNRMELSYGQSYPDIDFYYVRSSAI